MSINFNTSNIGHFLNYSSHKHVLILNGNSLRFIPLNQTSIFQRVAARFGYGPLSLNNIANFIRLHNDEISEKLSDANREIFYEKLSEKCSHYNNSYRHPFVKISNQALIVFKQQFSVCSYAYSSKSTTYNIEEGQSDGNVDFSYSNKKLGFGYVVDGSGHNNPVMQPVLKDLVDNFTQSYETALESQLFTSIESAQQFLESHLKQFGKTLSDDRRPIKKSYTFEDASYHPAMSFAQTIRIGSNHYLLSVELADTMLIIKKANGTFDTSLINPRPDFGLGSGVINVCATPISPGDTIIGFSDGIGEFLTLEECKEIISGNSSPELLEAFKRKIIEKG